MGSPRVRAAIEGVAAVEAALVERASAPEKPAVYIECGHGGTCRKPCAEWRFVPFVTARDSTGLVTAYCKKHLRDADSCGARPVVSDHLPRLSSEKEATNG